MQAIHIIEQFPAPQHPTDSLFGGGRLLLPLPSIPDDFTSFNSCFNFI